MFLLIRGTSYTDLYESIFTFHNVSINSAHRGWSAVAFVDLHSTMFLLILETHCST